MKFECSKCGTYWTGDAICLGKVHTGCKQKPKGVWGERSEDERPSPNQGRSSTSKAVKNFFQPEAEYVLWDKGKWRGWAVGSVEGYSDAFVNLKMHDGRQLDVLEERLKKEVKEGKVFVVRPDQLIEMLLHQLGRFEPTPTVSHLGELLMEVGLLYGELKLTREEDTTHEVTLATDLVTREVEEVNDD